MATGSFVVLRASPGVASGLARRCQARPPPPSSVHRPPPSDAAPSTRKPAALARTIKHPVRLRHGESRVPWESGEQCPAVAEVATVLRAGTRQPAFKEIEAPPRLPTAFPPVPPLP